MRLRKVTAITLVLLSLFSSIKFDSYAINYSKNSISIKHSVKGELYNEYELNAKGKMEKIVTQELDKDHFVVKVIDDSGTTTYSEVVKYEKQPISNINMSTYLKSGSDWAVNRFDLELIKTVTVGIMTAKIVAKVKSVTKLTIKGAILTGIESAISYYITYALPTVYFEVYAKTEFDTDRSTYTTTSFMKFYEDRAYRHFILKTPEDSWTYDYSGLEH